MDMYAFISCLACTDAELPLMDDLAALLEDFPLQKCSTALKRMRRASLWIFEADPRGRNAWLPSSRLLFREPLDGVVDLVKNYP